jgi:hypothetical protein
VVRVVVEVVVGLVVCGFTSRVADADNRSPLVWGALTAVLCLASLTIPVPIFRLVLAGAVVFVTMYVINLIRLPPI